MVSYTKYFVIWRGSLCQGSIETAIELRQSVKLRASSLGRHGGEAIKEGELASRLTQNGTRYVLDKTFFPLKGK